MMTASSEMIASGSSMMVRGSCAPAEYRQIILEKAPASAYSMPTTMTGWRKIAALELRDNRPPANARRPGRNADPPDGSVRAEIADREPFRES